MFEWQRLQESPMDLDQENKSNKLCEIGSLSIILWPAQVALLGPDMEILAVLTREPAANAV